jgi:hypothetical protein
MSKKCYLTSRFVKNLEGGNEQGGFGEGKIFRNLPSLNRHTIKNKI